ncbi:hypothetical protein AQS8620_01425 [Aquimixticola soesokkakensis]|uniref:Uncharacterized protein n=1 Tax=Aquimixticola soesokkakensis TaxID=1519096 RepID=A0A1Y5SHR6_9RHOB|nr:hypothetical protein [Aquimixticola soesokkakensis]SLN38120.1 hypothetical protein AQS8620_01425 [Aquimixticola soesokkakensis]
MDDVTVTLATPAKVGGKNEPQGKVLTVSLTVRDQLLAAGALVSGGEVVALLPDETTSVFEQAVAVKAKQIAQTIVEAAVEEAVTELTASANEANARADTAEAHTAEAQAQLTVMQDRVLELQAQLEAAPQGSVPQEAPEETAKTPAKVASKSKPKG